MPPNHYDISLQLVAPRGIAAVRGRIHASGVSAVFRDYLDQVYAVARAGTMQLDGQNIFVYRPVVATPDDLDVDFGVGVTTPFAGADTVAYTLTPGGRVATTTHWGDYSALGAAHDAIVGWCRSHDLRLAGPRWEVYGHWRSDTTPRTDIFYLIAAEPTP